MAHYQDHFVTVNGLRLHYLDWGTEGKPPFIMLHGGSAYAHWWDLVAPAFADDFHVLALDQRGHGDKFQMKTGPAGNFYQPTAQDLRHHLRW